jgi:hypothetical protein
LFLFYLCFVWRIVFACLVVCRCGMACSDEGHGRSRRPGAHVGYSVAGRSRGRVAPCAVCTWHVETRSVGFLVEPQNQGRRFVSGLASTPLGRLSPVWPQNRWRRFLAVWPQNLLRQFSLVCPQNQWRRFSPVWLQNWWRRFLLV